MSFRELARWPEAETHYVDPAAAVPRSCRGAQIRGGAAKIAFVPKAGSGVCAGRLAAVHRSDFGIDRRAHMRMAVFHRKARQPPSGAAIVQRLCRDTRTYKSMSMLGFAKVREFRRQQLDRLDAELMT